MTPSTSFISAAPGGTDFRTGLHVADGSATQANLPGTTSSAARPIAGDTAHRTTKDAPA